MKLYDFVGAPNPIKVRTYLSEKGLELELVPVDFMAGEHRSEGFRAKNPMAAIPVLELDDGRLFSESLAIIEYLEELHPQPAMIGSTPEERMRVRELERIAELVVMFNISRYLWNSHRFWAKRIDQSEPTAKLALRHMHGGLKALDAAIGDNEFVAGDHPTIADCTLWASLRFAASMRMEIDLSKRANVQRWRDAFSQRKSASA